jgi:hypothetical protein
MWPEKKLWPFLNTELRVTGHGQPNRGCGQVGYGNAQNDELSKTGRLLLPNCPPRGRFDRKIVSSENLPAGCRRARRWVLGTCFKI